MNLEKETRGLGLAVECIIVIEFAKEVYSYMKSQIEKLKARRKEKTMDEPEQ